MLFKSISFSSKSAWFDSDKSGCAAQDQAGSFLFSEFFSNSGLFGYNHSASFEFKIGGNYAFQEED
jgi:hypothetical protein